MTFLIFYSNPLNNNMTLILIQLLYSLPQKLAFYFPSQLLTRGQKKYNIHASQFLGHSTSELAVGLKFLKEILKVLRQKFYYQKFYPQPVQFLVKLSVVSLPAVRVIFRDKILYLSLSGRSIPFPKVLLPTH